MCQGKYRSPKAVYEAELLLAPTTIPVESDLFSKESSGRSYMMAIFHAIFKPAISPHAMKEERNQSFPWLCGGIVA